MSDAAERLIDHALGLHWEAIPNGARMAAQAFLLDSLAVGAAGRNAAHADSVLAMVQGWGEGGAAGVLGRSDLKLPAPSAAFVNAFQIHGQEYDCVHEAAVLHPMATVLSALLAELARGAAVDGRTFMTAIVAGVDVAVTLGLAAPGALTFFRPATAGIFGCVAAIASLRAMPREQALDAFGHALAFASGTMQAHVEGKPALPVQVANAARGALVAVDLARAGMPGIRGTVEGPFGYLSMLEGETALAPALAKLGQGHRIEEVSWKPFPTGRAGHGGIGAVQKLKAKGLSISNLAHLEYRAPPLIHRLVGRPAHGNMAPGYARLCLPYLAAVTLTRGTVSLSDFGAESLQDPELLALAAKVEVVIDGNPDQAAFVPTMATAQLSDGSMLTEAVPALLGSPSCPLSRSEQEIKAAACLAFAGHYDRLENLLHAVDTLADAPDALATIRASGVMT
ncbi:MmgE/PrpD family protein [Novosphingobium sp.]|uniref:MmgE/PrpD family protein n=1 Tax=Novosphingobium sp. TaxID=1874826 RepID=UPI00286DE900|nr:MmgE/PrpD family protein [Novosphingobium sp.]